MEKKYYLKGLDCPNCSAKIEREAGALAGVYGSVMNLPGQELTLEVIEGKEEQLLEALTDIVHSHEPDVEVIDGPSPLAVEGHDHEHEHEDACGCGEHEHDHEHEHEDACSCGCGEHDHDHDHDHEHEDACGCGCGEHEHDHELVSRGGMQQKFMLAGLDCPHCSALIEHEVGELPEVALSALNLMTQTLTVEFAGEGGRAAGEMDALLEKVEKIVHSHEPDVVVSVIQKNSRQEAAGAGLAGEEAEDSKRRIIRLIAGAVIYAAGFAMELLGVDMTFALPVLIIAYAVLGYDVVWTALRNITRGQIFDEHFLMSVSTIGAMAIGSYTEAVAVMLFYQIGELFQDLAVDKSRRSIAAMLNIRPDTANLKVGDEIKAVSPYDIAIGDIIVVKPGEKVPLDGIVVEGDSMLDTMALTGESLPRSVHSGQEILSGCVNLEGLLTVRVTKEFGESTVSRIIDMVENASARKAPTENFITTFARYYTPVVVAMALALAIIPPIILHGGWAEWVHRCFVFLVISCPCALVISIPLTFFGGIGAASRKGVLVKGSNYLEALNKVDTMVFDKTGTLTKGVFKVMEIQAAEGIDENELLRLAAHAEALSGHPIAKSVVAAWEERGGSVDTAIVSDYKELSGRGLAAVVEGRRVQAGSTRLMEECGAEYQVCESVGTKVYLAVDGIYQGCIVIADEIKADSAETIKAVKALGVVRTVMLTGDENAVAAKVAGDLGIDIYHSQLLPAQKVEELEKLLAEEGENGRVAVVGDGINDAPMLARADVGIAMGALGSDAAIEAADVVLMNDNPSSLADALLIAKATKSIVMQNIVFALGVKFLLLALGAVGIAGMWAAVFGDVGVMILAVLNSMRMLKK